MTDDNWKTIRVPAAAYNDAKEQKEENDRTWGEQLICNNATTTEVVEVSDIDGLTQEVVLEATDVRRIAEAVAEQLR